MKRENDLELSENTERLRYYLVLAFAFLLPFDRFYSTLTLYLIIISTLIDLKSIKLTKIPKQVWILSIPVLLSITGYFYSNFKNESIFIIEKQMTFLIFPVLIPLSINYINKKRIHGIFNSLKNGTFIAIFYLFLVHLSNIMNGKEMLYLTNSNFYNHFFASPLGIHASYLSIYVITSILYLFSTFSNKASWKTKTLYLFQILILFAGLIFLASRNAILIFLIITCFIYPLFYIRRKILYITVFMAVIGVSVVLISKNSYLNRRFGNELIEDIKLKKIDYSAIQEVKGIYGEPRIERWKLSIPIILQSPIIGHGTGEETNLMKKEYYENGFIISYANNYNIHNQYLSILIRHGIIGLLIMLTYIGFNLYLAIKTKNFLYITLLTIMMFGFLTENLLDSNKGIFFFAFFNTLLSYCSLSESRFLKNKY